MRRLTSTLLLTALATLTACQAADEAAPQVALPEPAAVEAEAKESNVAAPSALPAAPMDEAEDGEASAEAAPPPGAGKADHAYRGRDKRKAATGGPRRRPRPTVGLIEAPVQQAPAGVRAGEWDDNANYREFQKFLTASSRLSYHRMDLRSRRFLVVRDAEGKGVPSCKVRVSDGRKNVTLTTAASGRAILFPHAEGLGFSQNGLTAVARCAGDVAERSFELGANDGMVDLRLKTSRALPAQAVIDVAFILDTTGSMSEEIAAVKATIQQVASSLASKQYRVRLGLVEYKDRSDSFATKVYPMSQDLQRFATSVASIRATGGGDIPEDAVQGLEVGVNQLAWSEGSVARLAFMIGDAPPHLDYQDGGRYEEAAKTAAHRGIKIHTIAASGMDDLGQVVWRQIAQYTGATNMFVLRGGAGPQSTGGGDPKSSCGGTHGNYSSGNLDQLIVTKVERELRALKADPMAIAGLGQDERAKPCNERVAQL